MRGASSWLLLSAVVSAVSVTSRLRGIEARSISGESVDLGTALAATGRTLAVFGTYAADFNAIEYCQRLRHYLPAIRKNGVDRVVLILNASPRAAKRLCDELDMPSDGLEVLADEGGAAGRAFGVSRGWKPDADTLELCGASIPLSPYGKLFGMLWGLGALGTLPAVVGGYVGNPLKAQPWIADALKQNNQKGRWPEATADQFAALPLVGGWGRRPLELATLRLQNMLGVSLALWNDLKPADAHLNVLTQLGGCVVYDPSGHVLYEWKDPGICAVCNFEDLVAALLEDH